MKWLKTISSPVRGLYAAYMAIKLGWNAGDRSFLGCAVCSFHLRESPDSAWLFLPMIPGSDVCLCMLGGSQVSSIIRVRHPIKVTVEL